MKILFKITRTLLAAIRKDLRRPHDFAAERVGFIAAGFAMTAGDVLVLAHSYQPVADGDYVPDPTVGAMMGPAAIRKAMQCALSDRIGIFHVHSHGANGLPDFSDIDLREQARFMPSFLNVASHCPHGAIVLSNDMARGQVWLSRAGTQTFIEQFIEIGAPLRKWSGR